MQPIEILTHSVRAVVGSPDAEPRPGQRALCLDIATAFENRTHTSSAAPTGVGKALDVDTPIPTPSGWRKMGDLQVGDLVFSETGRPIRVIGAYDVQHDRPCFEVTFSDGSTIVADGEHLWTTSTRARRAVVSEKKRRRNITQRHSSFRKYLRLRAGLSRVRLGETERMQTLSSAAATSRGAFTAGTISEIRTKSGSPKLPKNQKVDLVPILDTLIARAAASSSILRKPEPLFQTVTTAEIMRTLRGQSNGANHALPIAGHLQLSGDQELPIDPYAFGAWLGDGTSNGGGFTSADSQIIESIRERGYEVRKLRGKYGYSLHVPGAPLREGVTSRLRALGVRNNKHIPIQYLRASYDQRLDLLRGLMDTDGTVSAQNGRSEIAVVNEHLARGVLELVRSLGITAHFSSGPAALTEADPENPGETRRRIVGTRYRVGFITHLPIANLDRKRALLPRATSTRARTRYIVDIQPVRSRPVRCITVDSERSLFLAGEGMVPTHNSLSFLSVAAHRVIEHGERVLLSTESLSLQSQLLDKDAPVVAAVVAEHSDVDIAVAVLKGVGNYVDPRRLLATANAIAGTDAKVGLQDLITRVTEVGSANSEVTATLDGADFATLRKLVLWGLEQYLDDNASGDRHSYPGQHTSAEWSHVSASSAEASGETDSPYFPKAMAAKERVAEADIVITNHTLLAIQAANGIPIVLGNANYGEFNHIVVDEAHALPDEVRAQGAAEVSGRAINGLVRAVKKVADDRDSAVRGWVSDGDALADLVETHLRQQLHGKDTARVVKDDDPLGDLGITLNSWAKRGGKLAAPASKSSDVRTMLNGRRAQTRADQFVAALGSITKHHSGEARWIEAPPPASDSKFRSWTSAQSSPVDVSGKIARNLWVTPVADGEPDEVSPLGVAAMSATLPQGFPFQAGLAAQTVEYESPFATAYGNSMLFIPSATSDADIEALSSDRYGKRKFDTKQHTAWARRHIVDLVRANQGSALVLAATSASGRLYADALRSSGSGVHVYSQWDGETTARLLAAWRADEGSVLVGTRSLMTGVDAPGEACTLVILDRIPRRPSNPMDDARVEQIMERSNIDKWSADRFVYAADAALLEEQAVGRLIRSTSDSGMAVVLDPRLLKTPGARVVFTYPEPTRQTYMKPLYKFENKTADKETALQWLRDRRGALGAAA